MAYSLPVAIRLLCLLWLPLACHLLLLGMEVAWDFSGNLLAFDVTPKGCAPGSVGQQARQVGNPANLAQVVSLVQP